MKQEHLSENELQQFALAQQETDDEMTAHVHECAKCAAAIANYRAMFSALSSLEKPVFDFNIEKQVMAGLPVPTKQRTSFFWPVFGISTIAVAIAAIPILIMRSFFVNLFTSTPGPILYLILITALTIVIFQCSELLASYREKMRLLNYY